MTKSPRPLKALVAARTTGSPPPAYCRASAWRSGLIAAGTVGATGVALARDRRTEFALAS
jgi:hypothetical protein